MKSAIKRILNIDMKRINNADLKNNGIFIEFDEKNILKAKALIIGPKGTIYDNAYLFFTIEFPNNYPFAPPILTYKSQNKIRIHPNIYVNGKVCLSILGTWSGPSWTPVMDITNVLITIQSLLDNNPLCNEPGYENISDKKFNLHQNYIKLIEYNTLNSLILDRLTTEYEDFEIFKSEMLSYFKKNHENIFFKIKSNKNIPLEEININIYKINQIIDYNNLNKKYINVIKKIYECS